MIFAINVYSLLIKLHVHVCLWECNAKDGILMVRPNLMRLFLLFFQLHVYPGYEPDEVTPLPEPLQAREILATIINAQLDLRKKVRLLY